MTKLALITALDEADVYSRVAVNLGPIALEAYLSQRSKGRIKTFIVETETEVVAIKPDFIGISCVTENYGRAIALASSLKAKLHVPIFVGGVHMSALPESLDPVFDAGIIGEGEETFLELLEKFPKIEGIKGIVFHKHVVAPFMGPKAPDKSGNYDVHINPRRLPIKELDSLPMPNLKKWVERIGLPYVMTTRGCPYKCSFCSSPVHWCGYREFSPERVVSEVEALIGDFNIRHIRFFDDVLTLNKKRLKKIVSLIDERGLNKKVNFSCFSRVGLMDQETIALLKRGMVDFVSVGIESASSEMISLLKDKPFKIKSAQNVIDRSVKEGLNMGCSFLIGTPGETEADLEATCRFIEKNGDKLFEAEINPFVPRPGTPYWGQAAKRGLVGLNMDWSRLKDYSFLPHFDPDRYIYVNEKMPYKVFLKYVERLTGLFNKISIGKKKIEIMSRYISPAQMPAKLTYYKSPRRGDLLR